MKRLIRLLLLCVLLPAHGLAQTSREEIPLVNVRDYTIDLELVPENSYLKGQTTVRFDVLNDTISVPFDLNSRISLIEVADQAGNVYSPSFDSFNSSRMLVRGDEPFKSGQEYQLTFSYDGTLEPEQYAYLDDTARSEKAVIDSDGALLLTEGLWFPSHQIRTDPASFELTVTVPLGYTVVAPGDLQPIQTKGVKESFTWKSPLPQSGIPVSVARYYRQQFEGPDIGLTFYAGEGFSGDITPLLEEIRKALEFFESEFGALPALTQLSLVDVGNVRLPSTGGTGLMMLESSFLGAHTPKTMEVARRVALQWWDYLLPVRSGQDLWLQEAFAQYAALHYIEAKFPDRFQTELARLAIEALKYEERAPVLQGYTLGAGSDEYYSVVAAKGAWVLYMLRQLVGDQMFNSVIADWYRENVGEPVTTQGFIDFVNERTGQDYNWFFAQWIESTGVPEFTVDYQIFKESSGSYKIRGQIKQDLELFRMPADLLIETKGQPEEKHLRLTGKNTSYQFETETQPVRVVVDPHGKILRDSDQMRVQVNIAIGEEFQTQGDYLSAIREFEQAKELDPRSSYAHYRLGETYFLQHSYSNAANSFRDALNGDLQPEWVQTWTNIYLGKIYDILGQRERALAEYTKALNSKIDYNGAQAEAQKYLQEPYSKPKTLIN